MPVLRPIEFSLRTIAALLVLAGCTESLAAQDSAGDVTRQTVTRQTWDTESGLPQNTIQAILQTHDGYIWLATEGGLARFNSERFTIFNARNTPQLRSNDIRDLLEDATGTLWIATSGGVAARTDQKFKSFPLSGATGLFLDAANRPCAMTATGAACFEHGRFRAAYTEVPPKAPALGRTLQNFVNSRVLCTMRDREGNVWIGTESSGVTILRNLHFEAFSDRAEGLDDQVRCVYRDRSGAVWFGTDSQGLTRFANGVFSRFTVANGLSSNVIVSLGEDATGDLLIGTPDGLNRLHKGTITVETSSEGLPDDFIRSIHTDADGTVWIGTRRGLARLRDNQFRTYTHADGLGSDLIGSIIRDTKGTLWVATLQGLSRSDGTRFTNFTAAGGLSGNIITALYADVAGSLWIGTQGGGLNRYAGGVFKRIIAPQIPETIDGITGDLNRKLWLASPAGIFRLQPDTGEVVNYGVSDGLRVNECSGGGHPAIANAPDGAIWFATMKGAALLRADVAFNRIPPPVVVESVTVDNRTLAAAAKIKVAPGATRIAINYAALSFTAPQKIQFRYRLEGFDKTWQEATARTAFYTNLGPGNYSFQVIARNGDGVWNNQGATLHIQIEPRFYQTWWFVLTIVLALAAGGVGIYQWRVARVAAQMESRFEAVLQERNRIAREIHDTLAQGFAGISVQLELVSRKLGADAAREHLDQARMLVRSSLAEARRSIWELRSQSSEIEDLASRVSKMAAQMSGTGPPKIAVQVRGAFHSLPPRTEDELLRIAQEAVTNAIRHAEASAIHIELAFDPKLVRMTIADDGRGFTPSGQTTGINGHFGLQGMHERAEAINAKLNLDTAPGAGTRLSVEIAV